MIFFGWKLFLKSNIDNYFFNEKKVYKQFFLNTDPLTIFDIGANIGQSISIFLNLFPSCNIHAFEPSNSAYQILSKRYSSNKKVHLNHMGLWNESKKLSFNNYTHSTLSSFMQLNPYSKENHRTIKAKDCLNNKSEIDVQKVITLDEYVSDHQIKHIHILKIDVQGSEKMVLEGTSLSLKIVDVIKVEITLDNCYGSGTTFKEIEDLLPDDQFVLYDICHIYKAFDVQKTIWLECIYVNKLLLTK